MFNYSVSDEEYKSLVPDGHDMRPFVNSDVMILCESAEFWGAYPFPCAYGSNIATFPHDTYDLKRVVYNVFRSFRKRPAAYEQWKLQRCASPMVSAYHKLLIHGMNYLIKLHFFSGPDLKDGILRATLATLQNMTNSGTFKIMHSLDGRTGYDLSATRLWFVTSYIQLLDNRVVSKESLRAAFTSLISTSKLITRFCAKQLFIEVYLAEVLKLVFKEEAFFQQLGRDVRSIIQGHVMKPMTNAEVDAYVIF